MKQHMKPNLFRWGHQWPCWPRCECHPSITQCKPINKNIESKVMKGHTFVCSKHEIACLLWWKWRHPKRNCEMQSFPHHGNKKKGRSLLDIRAGHKCNQSIWELKDGEGPTWCAMKRRKHQRPNKKMEWLNEQKAIHPPLSAHKIASMHDVNKKPCLKGF